MADELCSPQIATGSGSDLGYQEEVCYGDLPAVPALKTVRRRSTSLTLTKDAYDSEEIRSDRMTSDSRHGIRRANGDIVTEISPGGHSDFYEALLGGQWASIDDIAITSSATAVSPLSGAPTIRVSSLGDVVAAGLYPGNIIRFTGTGEAGFDGKLFQVIAEDAGGAGWIEIYPLDNATLASYPTLDSGQVEQVATTGMGNIYRSFLMERAFSDIGSFVKFRGMRFNSASIDLPPTGIATSTFAMVGKDADPISAASFDGVAEIVLDATDLTSLTFDGAAGTITGGVGSDFVTAGITVGDRVIVAGDGITDLQNRNPRTVTAVTATVLTVAEAIQTGGPYTTPFTVTRVGLPDYMAADDEAVLVAVSGLLIYKGQVAGTVTSMNINIDNAMAGSEVVGRNVIPANLYGNRCSVSGSLTVLFDRGGIGEQIYNAFDLEEDDISIFMTLTTPDGTEAVSFVMPRCKINSGSIGDAVAEGLPVSVDYRALRPRSARVPASQIVIADSKAA